MGILLVLCGLIISVLLLDWIIRGAINSSKVSSRLDQVVSELSALRQELRMRDERDRQERAESGRVIDTET